MRDLFRVNVLLTILRLVVNNRYLLYTRIYFILAFKGVTISDNNSVIFDYILGNLNNCVLGTLNIYKSILRLFTANGKPNRFSILNTIDIIELILSEIASNSD